MGGTSTKKKKASKEIADFVSWFEIPAANFQQAVAFYNHIYGMEMETTAAGEHAMAFFPSSGGIGGAVVSGPGAIPNENGPLIYLNGGEDLNVVLGKVEDAGGRVVLPKTVISGDAGYFAIFIDSEGNKLALHSKS